VNENLNIAGVIIASAVVNYLIRVTPFFMTNWEKSAANRQALPHHHAHGGLRRPDFPGCVPSRWPIRAGPGPPWQGSERRP
jgi:hypothetical protein